MYTNKESLEKSNIPFYPTDGERSRGNQVPSRGENEGGERKRGIDILRGAKEDTERAGKREKITGSFVPFVRGSSLCQLERGLEDEKIIPTGFPGVAWRVCILRGCWSIHRLHTRPPSRKHAGATTPAIIIINPFSRIPPGYTPVLLSLIVRHHLAPCSSRKRRNKGGKLESEYRVENIEKRGTERSFSLSGRKRKKRACSNGLDRFSLSLYPLEPR